jgi:hypothetical protein
MMTRFRLMDWIAATVLTLGLCVISSQASAAVVCVGTGPMATSCSGVVYNGTTYDVTWALPDYPTGPTPLFTEIPLTDSSDAASTADAINTALNTGGFSNIQYTTTGGPSSAPVCGSGTTPCYYVPYRINPLPPDENVSSWESRYSTTWTRTSNPSFGYLITDNPNQNDRPVTVFTPAAVPVPAALPLFLSGIALVGWVGRRRSQGC